jgi:transcriptional regulator with XRE-family HTH domain
MATLIEEARLEELKRLREEKGWSQTRLAQESGIDRATINQVEGGRRSPTISTLEVLAAALGVEVADFFPKAQPPLPDLWGTWRSQLELLESCVQYKISRAEYYEQKLERGRASDYATARGAENLAISALQEFADFTRWVIDGPVRPLAIALEQVPSPVDPRIAEEFEGKVDVMIYRAKQTTDLLFQHAYHLAETAEERAKFDARRRQAEEATEDLRGRIA